MTEGIRYDLLKYSEVGETRYTTFCKKRLVEKTMNCIRLLIGQTCATWHLYTTNQQSQQKLVSRKQSNSVISLNVAIEIARAHGVRTEQLLTYDLCPSPLLHNKDGTMSKPEKHKLLTELEMGLEKSDCEMGNVGAQIVDVMGLVRTLTTRNFKTLGDITT